MNGVKTHPLTTHALEALRWLKDGPQPTSKLNPGVTNRLQREDLIEIVDLESPFKTHRGKKIAHAQITQTGLARLQQEGS